MKVQIREFFYISNLLSISRVLFAIPIAYYIRLNTPDGNVILLILCVIATATDFLDGYFSRRLNQVTDLGILLDPIADKISMAIILISLIIYRDFSIPLTIFLVYRDLLIVLVGSFTIKNQESPVMANFLGKINTCLLAFTAILYMANVKNEVFTFFLIASYLSIFISGFSYMKVGEELLFTDVRKRYIFRAGVVLLTIAVVYLTGSNYAFI